MTDFGKSILESAVRDHPESIPAKKILENFHHFVNINEVLNGKWEWGWGSYMFNGLNYIWQRETLKKQEALFRVGEKSKNALEIGVYLGHSLLILLISNPDLKITCIDNDDRFSPKVVDYLNKNFGNRLFFHLGDAVKIIDTLPTGSFDLVHVDADHNNEAVMKQFNSAKRCALSDAHFVFDDYEATRGTIDLLLKENILKSLVLPNCLWTNIVTQLVVKKEDKIIDDKQQHTNRPIDQPDKYEVYYSSIG